MYRPLKKIVKNTAFKIASFGPMIGYLRKIKGAGKIPILMYHEIADDCDEIEAWTVVKRSDFLRQMSYLIGNYNVVSLAEAIESIKDPAARGGKPMAVITFDDGYAGNNNVMLPIIKSMGVPVTVFVATRAVLERSLYWYDRLINALQRGKAVVTSGYLASKSYRINYCRGAENWREIERLLNDLKKLRPDVREDAVDGILRDFKSRDSDYYNVRMLSVDGLRELSACHLVTIGAHSHCHNILTQLSGEALRKSVKESKGLLESWTDKRVEHFSYPNGDFDDNVINAVREAGFKSSVAIMSRLWERGDSPFMIPRIGVGRYDTLNDFKIKTSGVFARRTAKYI